MKIRQRQEHREIRLDSIMLDKTYFTDEGYLIDHPIVTSVGIFEYGQPDGSVRRELRLPEEVFSKASLQSYKGKPVIITHDAGYVDKSNVDEENIGTILSDGYQDGNDVRAEIVIHDTDAMKSSGLRELSLGYNLRLDETPGVWNGQPYDAIQRDITINHLAIVRSARAGEQARLNIDSRDGTTKTGGKEQMRKNGRRIGRRDGENESPDDLTAAIEAFKKRRAERLGAKQDEEEQGAEKQPQPAPDDVEYEDEEEIQDPQPKDNPTDPDNQQQGDEDEEQGEGSGELLKQVKDRRDRRDADGDPERMDKAMGMIAQQDEDIDTLLGLLEALLAKQQGDGCSNEDEDEEAPKNDNSPEGNEDEDDESGDQQERKDSKDFREMLHVIRVGDRLNMDGLEMMSVKNAKKTILKKLRPSLRLDGKSSTYVNAAFDMAVNDLKTTRKDTNYQRRQMNGYRNDSKGGVSKGTASEARQRMIAKRKREE